MEENNKDALQPGQTVGENYILKRKLDAGSFATVWLAEHKLAGRFVAIKVVNRTTINSQDSNSRFLREMNLFMKMDHPFIAELFEIVQDDSYIFLVMELLEKGNLLNYVNTHGMLPEGQARRLFSQLLSALEYLHNVKYVAHRDLKAENVLLDKNNNIRLIDFGLSNIFSDEKPELSTACGSPAYAAPEMIRGMKYTKAADVWSAGILLYAMVVGELPFDDPEIQRLLQKIAFTEPDYPPFLSCTLVDLMTKILHKNPEERITIEKIKEHPWFSQCEYAEIMKMQFYQDKKWLVSGLNRDIIDQISAMGADVKILQQDLLCGQFGPSTSLYRILRRDQITEDIREMMQSLTGGSTGVKGNNSISRLGDPPNGFTIPTGYSSGRNRSGSMKIDINQPTPIRIQKPVVMKPGIPSTPISRRPSNAETFSRSFRTRPVHLPTPKSKTPAPEQVNNNRNLLAQLNLL